MDSHPIGKMFIDLCSSVISKTNAVKKNPTQDGVSTIVSHLRKKIDQLHRAVLTTWPHYNREDLKEYLYNYAISKMHSHLHSFYDSKCEKENKVLAEKIEEAKDLSPADMGVKKCFWVHAHNVEEVEGKQSYVFSMGAITLFKQMHDWQNLSEKINCIVATIQVICNSVTNYITATSGAPSENSADLVVSADDLLPMLCYVIKEAKVENIYSEVHFLLEFGYQETVSSGQTGYCLSMVEGALEHLMNLKITPPATPPVPPKVENNTNDREPTAPLTKSSSETSTASSLEEPPTSPTSVTSPMLKSKSGSSTTLWGSPEDLRAAFSIEPEQVKAKFVCAYPNVMKKGVMLVTETHLYFHVLQGKGDTVMLSFKDIFAIKKAKFGFLDNSIEVVLRNEWEETFKGFKFINVEERNATIQYLHELHEAQQSLLERPSIFIIQDKSIDPADEYFEMEFSKIREGVCNGHYECSEDDAVLFASLLAQIQFGDCNPSKLKPGFFKQSSSRSKVIPFDWRDKISEEKLMNAYKKLWGMSESNVKCYFIKKARELVKKTLEKPNERLIYFVKEVVNKKVRPVILGISKESIFRINMDTLELFDEKPLDDVKRYVYRDDILSMDLGKMDKTETFYHIFTKEGEIITQVLAQFQQ